MDGFSEDTKQRGEWMHTCAHEKMFHGRIKDNSRLEAFECWALRYFGLWNYEKEFN